MNNNIPRINDDLLFIDEHARDIHDLIDFLRENPAGIESRCARDYLRRVQEHCAYVKGMSQTLIDEISEKENKKYEEQKVSRSLQLVPRKGD